MDATPARSRGPVSLEDERQLVIALRAGDERVFVRLVRAHHASLMRVARSYVGRADVAEEVVQEAWQGLIESLPRFTPETATVKTWLFRILVNCARARSRKERHSRPSSSLDEDQPAVPPDRFQPDGHLWAGHWSSAPRRFVLDDPAVSRETRELLTEAIAALPETQREVMVLRDVEGWPAEEVCNALGLSDMNQRVLLHRARSRVRGFLEERLGEDG